MYVQETPKGLLLTTRVDVVNANLTYVGYSIQGTATSASGWTVQEVISSGGNVQSVKNATGGQFGAIWDNRAVLTYN